MKVNTAKNSALNTMGTKEFEKVCLLFEQNCHTLEESYSCGCNVYLSFSCMANRSKRKRTQTELVSKINCCLSEKTFLSVIFGITCDDDQKIPLLLSVFKTANIALQWRISNKLDSSGTKR